MGVAHHNNAQTKSLKPRLSSSSLQNHLAHETEGFRNVQECCEPLENLAPPHTSAKMECRGRSLVRQRNPLSTKEDYHLLIYVHWCPRIGPTRHLHKCRWASGLRPQAQLDLDW